MEYPIRSQSEFVDRALLLLGQVPLDNAQSFATQLMTELAKIVVRTQGEKFTRSELVVSTLNALSHLPPDELVPAAKNLIAVLTTIIADRAGHREAFNFLNKQTDILVENGNLADRFDSNK
jgi:hypothetical protein